MHKNFKISARFSAVAKHFIKKKKSFTTQIARWQLAWLVCFVSLCAISVSSDFTCLRSSLSRIIPTPFSPLRSAVSHFSAAWMLKQRRFVSPVYCSTDSLRWSANAPWYFARLVFCSPRLLSFSVALFYHLFSFFSPKTVPVSSLTTEFKWSSLLFILHRTDMRSALEYESLTL